MRNRTGKAARLSGVDFDREGVNTVAEKPVAAETVVAEAEETKPE